MGKSYHLNDVMKYLAIMIGVMIAMKASGGSGFLIVVPLALMALAKNNVSDLFFYLLLTVSMLMGNAYLMPKNMVFGLAQRGLLIFLGGMMIIRSMGYRNSTYVKPLLLMTLYLAVAVVSSLQGWNVIISLLKIFLFVMIYFSYFGVANLVVTENRGRVSLQVRAALLAVAIFFICGSVALIPFPGIGQLTGLEYEDAIKAGKTVTSLFKGMTMHSQSLGPMIVILFIVLLGDLILSVRRADNLYLFLIFLCPILIFKTSSRTAMGSLIFGTTVLLYYVMQARGLRSTWKSKVMSTFMMVILVGSIVTLILPSARERISQFALKSQDVTSEDLSFGQIASSRLGKWEEGIANFKKSPFIGNGFQVSEDMQYIRAGLTTLSAPVEKSVWVSAVLEETGILGFFVFLIFILSVFFKGNVNRCYIGNTAFLTFLVSNMGEFTLFSMSYTGGFQWAMVFVGYMFDATRQRAMNGMALRPLMRMLR